MTETVLASKPIPVGSIGRHASGYWGMLLLILTEAPLFAYLMFSYFYFAVRAHETWPPTGLPHFRISAPNTLILMFSSICVWWGERGLRRENSKPKLLLGLAGGMILAQSSSACNCWSGGTRPSGSIPTLTALCSSR